MDTTSNTRSVRRTSGELALTLLRVVTGVILLVHGWGKLTDVPSWQAQLASMGMPAPEVLSWFAIAGEFLGGLGLIVGLLTPIAALGAAATMAAAIVSVHAGNGLLAKNGGMEFPLLLLCVSLVFAVRGAGRFSLDALLGGMIRSRTGAQHVVAEWTPGSAEGPPRADAGKRKEGKRTPSMHEPKWSHR